MPTSQEAYLKGRLEGLYQLVEILRNQVQGKSEKPAELVKELVNHVYEELAEIIEQMNKDMGMDNEKYEKAAKAVKEGRKAVEDEDALEPHMDKTKDLMKELMAARK
ncbi:MAG: hypothetical protein JXA43_00800 [Candidatus Diapherotrites archaeon]|nr:hypothetical protein [Candidatus Diapherotrites archaeon]